MEGPAAARKVAENPVAVRKFALCLRKVRLMHEKLTDGPSDARKADGRSRDCSKADEMSRDHMESYLKLREGPVAIRTFSEGLTDAQKLDGS